MDVPAADVAECRAAHDRLRAMVVGLTDDDVGRPSRLPDWTIGHVLTHLARNADSVVRRLEGAARDEVLDQYVGGAQGRAAEIEQGAGRLAAAVVADVIETSNAVDAAFTSFSDAHWGRLARGVTGDERPVGDLPFQRWREVDVHLVDLGLGYEPSDWPAALVDRWLPELARRLPQRTDAHALMAWTLGRGPVPDLDPF
jgi:maleylpyruvate isomerase